MVVQQPTVTGDDDLISLIAVKEVVPLVISLKIVVPVRRHLNNVKIIKVKVRYKLNGKGS